MLPPPTRHLRSSGPAPTLADVALQPRRALRDGSIAMSRESSAQSRSSRGTSSSSISRGRGSSTNPDRSRASRGRGSRRSSIIASTSSSVFDQSPIGVRSSSRHSNSIGRIRGGLSISGSTMRRHTSDFGQSAFGDITNDNDYVDVDLDFDLDIKPNINTTTENDFGGAGGSGGVGATSSPHLLPISSPVRSDHPAGWVEAQNMMENMDAMDDMDDVDARDVMEVREAIEAAEAKEEREAMEEMEDMERNARAISSPLTPSPSLDDIPSSIRDIPDLSLSPAPPSPKQSATTPATNRLFATIPPPPTEIPPPLPSPTTGEYVTHSSAIEMKRDDSNIIPSASASSSSSASSDSIQLLGSRQTRNNGAGSDSEKEDVDPETGRRRFTKQEKGKGRAEPIRRTTVPTSKPSKPHDVVEILESPTEEGEILGREGDESIRILESPEIENIARVGEKRRVWNRDVEVGVDGVMEEGGGKIRKLEIEEEEEEDGDGLEEYSCPVCFCNLTQPVQTLCGHVLCAECLRSSLLAAIGRQPNPYPNQPPGPQRGRYTGPARGRGRGSRGGRGTRGGRGGRSTRAGIPSSSGVSYTPLLPEEDDPESQPSEWTSELLKAKVKEIKRKKMEEGVKAVEERFIEMGMPKENWDIAKYEMGIPGYYHNSGSTIQADGNDGNVGMGSSGYLGTAMATVADAYRSETIRNTRNARNQKAVTFQQGLVNGNGEEEEVEEEVDIQEVLKGLWRVEGGYVIEGECPICRNPIPGGMGSPGTGLGSVVAISAKHRLG